MKVGGGWAEGESMYQNFYLAIETLERKLPLECPRKNRFQVYTQALWREKNLLQLNIHTLTKTLMHMYFISVTNTAGTALLEQLSNTV